MNTSTHLLQSEACVGRQGNHSKNVSLETQSQPNARGPITSLIAISNNSHSLCPLLSRTTTTHTRRMMACVRLSPSPRAETTASTPASEQPNQHKQVHKSSRNRQRERNGQCDSATARQRTRRQQRIQQRTQQRTRQRTRQPCARRVHSTIRLQQLENTRVAS